MKLITSSVVFVVILTIISASPISEKGFELGDYVEVTRNSYKSNTVSGRSSDIETNVEEFIKSHDVNFKLPLVDSTVSLSSKNLDNGEIDLKLKLNNDGQVEGRKSKLRKIFAPLFVFILIKAMVLIPLALGILAIKTWNALQLSFVSFVIAVVMGVWQLCKKVAGDSAPQHIIAHEPWHRNFNVNEDAQQLAYSAYAQQ